MNCKITYTPDFARALKKLSKRYRSMKQDYAQLLEDLHQITIYDKSERDNISDAELLEILRRNGIEA